jgi:hypothetical protein
MRLPPKPRQPDPLEELLRGRAYEEIPITLVPHGQAVPLGVMVRGALEPIFPRWAPPRASAAPPEGQITHPKERWQRLSPTKRPR